MKENVKSVLNELLNRYPALREQEENIIAAFEILKTRYAEGNKLLVCGNGGSAADSEHIVGELMKKFKKPREIESVIAKKLATFGTEGEKLAGVLEGALPAISLTSHIALSTAFANDKEPTAAFAQQVYGLGVCGDVLICISTSGNSENCYLAAITAKAKWIKVISLTGKTEGKLSSVSDVTVFAPETETYKVQEFHLPIYHALCAMLEEEFF